MAIVVGNPKKLTLAKKVVVKKPTFNAAGAGQGGDETPDIQGKQNAGAAPDQNSKNPQMSTGNDVGARSTIQGGSGVRNMVARKLYGKRSTK